MHINVIGYLIMPVLVAETYKLCLALIADDHWTLVKMAGLLLMGILIGFQLQRHYPQGDRRRSMAVSVLLVTDAVVSLPGVHALRPFEVLLEISALMLMFDMPTAWKKRLRTMLKVRTQRLGRGVMGSELR
ncbi:hypothetical protein Q0M94_24145 (plasmid) [Deinococcus radiomollis]|uniref:hypothetical protein n=1 Tax=Deinococcus radiomollis TaxID=468916 RepID=UPI0038920298